MTDKELIQRCIKNDRIAQGELFKRYKDTLYFVSLKYCRNTAEAEDNLHDAFMAIFDSIHNYKGQGSFEGWMKRITIFKAIDRYKNNKYIPVAVFEETLTEDDIELAVSKVSLDQLLKSIQELPDQYRLVFNLFQLDGHSHKEVSEILNITEGSSKSNYHRAKQILQKEITSLIASSKTQKHGA